MSQKKKAAINKPQLLRTPSTVRKTSIPSTKAGLLKPKEEWYITYAPYLWIFGVCMLVYFQSIQFQFTGLDDSFFLVVYAQYFADARNFWRGFKESGVLDYYRPILFGSMIFDYQVTKTDPLFYHITNIVYHFIGCWALYKMLLKLQFDKTLALLTTLIFTAHPLWVMAVSWIPGRNDPMVTMLILGSFNYFLDYIKKGGFLNLILHWFLFAVALYTKETSALFPIICCFYFLLMTDWRERIKTVMTVGAGWAIIGLVWYAIRAEALELANKNGTRFTSIIYGDSWVKNLPDWPEYIGKLTIPLNLSNFPKFSAFSTYLGCAIIIGWIVLILLAKERRNNLLLFFGVWLLLFFGPATMFIFADSGRYDYLEHRFHTPAIAFIVFLNEILRSFFAKEGREKYKPYFVYGLSGIVALFAGYAIFHSYNFKNPENFWKKAIEGAPLSSQVYRGMGKVYYDSGDLPKAEFNFTKALELNKAEVNTISDIGKAYEGKGDMVSAERCYRKTLKVDSLNPVYMTDMARVYEKKRDLDNAEKWYLKVIARDPNFWQAKFGLGVLSYQKGRLADAEKYWLDVLKVNPGYNDTYMNLAVLYFYAQRFDKSIEYIDMLKNKGVEVEKLNPGLVNSLKPHRKSV